VVAASYGEYTSFLAQLESDWSKLKAHDTLYLGFALDFTLSCPTAKRMEGIDKDTAETMWEDISHGAKIDYGFDEDTLFPPMKRLFNDTLPLHNPPYAEFLEFFKHHNDAALTFAHGMGTVHTGADLWRKAELRADGALLAINPNPSGECDKGISNLTTAAKIVVLEAEKYLAKGFKQLESLLGPAPSVPA
jgi:hypothetical protein